MAAEATAKPIPENDSTFSGVRARWGPTLTLYVLLPPPPLPLLLLGRIIMKRKGAIRRSWAKRQMTRMFLTVRVRASESGGSKQNWRLLYYAERAQFHLSLSYRFRRRRRRREPLAMSLAEPSRAKLARGCHWLAARS